MTSCNDNDRGGADAVFRRNFSPYEASLLDLWFEKPGRALIRKGCVSYLMEFSTDDVRKIFKVLQREIEAARSRFGENGGRSDSEFKLA